MVAANQEYMKKEYDMAARKYEEAYSCWRYFISKNPNWANEGIDDTQLTEVEWHSANKWENEQVLKHKVTVLLNISACLMKSKNWQDTVPCLNEVLHLDPTNKTALYRRSKALSKPVNSSVEDFKKAVADLKALNSTEVRVLRRIAKLEQKIKHNSKKEHEVYSKMFTRSEAEPTVTEFVEKNRVKIEPIKSTADKEVDEDLAKISKEVDIMVAKKATELSFEQRPESEREDFPEFDQLSQILVTFTEQLRVHKKLGKHQEYQVMKERIKELQFAFKHLFLVMNMDTTKPLP